MEAQPLAANLSFAQLMRLKDEARYKQVPLVYALPMHNYTPTQVLRVLKGISTHCYLLESAQHGDRGRYSFLGFDPTLEIYCQQGHMHIGDAVFLTDDPNFYIRQILHEHSSYKVPEFPPFCGGLVGYFSFEYLGYQEKSICADKYIDEHFRDVDLMLFDQLITFDHLQNKILLTAQVELKNLKTSYNKALLKIEQLEQLITRGKPAYIEAGSLTGELHIQHSKKSFCEMIVRAKKHIMDGDIFQIVLSNKISAAYHGSLLDTYEELKTINPSPYMFYFSGDDLEIAGSSPETLVQLQDGVLHTYPLAGTRRRGQNAFEDKQQEKQLLHDEKELAEHNMLVDLGRNDLGKVSTFGSVCVERLHSIERFSHVMHLGSAVRGCISPDKDALDAIVATMPAGTLSGAPKISACRLIAQLEKTRRGIYGGALGYLDFSGNMDTCIGIRLLYTKNGEVHVQTGAGIVADSQAEKEYEECMNKARSSLAALHIDDESMHELT